MDKEGSRPPQSTEAHPAPELAFWQAFDPLGRASLTVDLGTDALSIAAREARTRLVRDRTEDAESVITDFVTINLPRSLLHPLEDLPTLPTVAEVEALFGPPALQLRREKQRNQY